jgi:iron-sulfur cluster assembly protein
MIREELQTAPQPMETAFEAVSLTSGAAAKLREVMDSKGLAEAGLRVFVSGGGCSGLQYGMAFETAGENDDHIFETEGVKIFVDPVSISYLQGATVDYEESLMGGGFKIENPNAQQSCGCGHSFKTQDAGAASGGGGGGCGCSH